MHKHFRPRLHQVHDGDVCCDGLLVRLWHRSGHGLHNRFDDVPAGNVLCSCNHGGGRPLLRAVRPRHFLAGNHALFALDGAARWLHAAEHILPCRHLLLGPGYSHGGPYVQRLRGRHVCIGSELGGVRVRQSGFGGLRIEAKPDLSSRNLLQPEVDGHGRSYLLRLPCRLLLVERHKLFDRGQRRHDLRDEAV